MKLLRFIFLYLWSYCPVLALTDDSNFGTLDIRKGPLKTKNLRLSVLCLRFGNVIIHFTSICLQQKAFQFFKILKLDNYDSCNLKEVDANNKVEEYRKHLLQYSKIPRISNEREFLKYLLTEENERIYKSSEKINLYTTIILVAIPLIIAFLNIKDVIAYNAIQLILFSLCFYAVLNFTLLVFQTAKVRVYNKSSFSTLKNSEDTEIELNARFYYDWKMIMGKANLFVSYVLNIQTWIKFALALVIIFSLYSGCLEISNLNSGDSIIQSNQVQTIELTEVEDIFSDSSKKLTKLLMDIQNRNVSRMFVLSNTGNVQNERIKELLNKAKGVDIIFIVDISLNENELKIFVED